MDLLSLSASCASSSYFQPVVIFLCRVFFFLFLFIIIIRGFRSPVVYVFIPPVLWCSVTRSRNTNLRQLFFFFFFSRFFGQRLGSAGLLELIVWFLLFFLPFAFPRGSLPLSLPTSSFFCGLNWVGYLKNRECHHLIADKSASATLSRRWTQTNWRKNFVWISLSQLWNKREQETPNVHVGARWLKKVRKG